MDNNLKKRIGEAVESIRDALLNVPEHADMEEPKEVNAGFVRSALDLLERRLDGIVNEEMEKLHGEDFAARGLNKETRDRIKKGEELWNDMFGDIFGGNASTLDGADHAPTNVLGEAMKEAALDNMTEDDIPSDLPLTVDNIKTLVAEGGGIYKKKEDGSVEKVEESEFMGENDYALFNPRGFEEEYCNKPHRETGKSPVNGIGDYPPYRSVMDFVEKMAKDVEEEDKRGEELKDELSGECDHKGVGRREEVKECGEYRASLARETYCSGCGEKLNREEFYSKQALDGVIDFIKKEKDAAPTNMYTYQEIIEDMRSKIISTFINK